MSLLDTRVSKDDALVALQTEVVKRAESGNWDEHTIERNWQAIEDFTNWQGDDDIVFKFALFSAVLG